MGEATTIEPNVTSAILGRTARASRSTIAEFLDELESGAIEPDLSSTRTLHNTRPAVDDLLRSIVLIRDPREVLEAYWTPRGYRIVFRNQDDGAVLEFVSLMTTRQTLDVFAGYLECRPDWMGRAKTRRLDVPSRRNPLRWLVALFVPVMVMPTLIRTLVRRDRDRRQTSQAPPRKPN